MPKKSDNLIAITKLISERIESLRAVRGLSLEQLGDKIGVSHQQVAKYCNGSNRITADRLSLVAIALGASMDYFFDHNELLPSGLQRAAYGLVHDFVRIESESARHAIKQAVKILAENK